jgi:multiple sugar transport system substrate-binding protein
MPIPDNGQRKCVPGGNVFVVLSKDPAQQKSAFDAISELVGPTGITMLVKETGYTPVNQVAATQPDHLKTFLDSNPIFAANADQITDLVPWFGWPGQHAREIESAIDQHIVQALRGSTTPQAALSAAATQAESLLG